jgi:hypothetical protein
MPKVECLVINKKILTETINLCIDLTKNIFSNYSEIITKRQRLVLFKRTPCFLGGTRKLIKPQPLRNGVGKPRVSIEETAGSPAFISPHQEIVMRTSRSPSLYLDRISDCPTRLFAHPHNKKVLRSLRATFFGLTFPRNRASPSFYVLTT